MSLSLKVEDVSKLYRLGKIGSNTLKDDLRLLWAEIRGKENPFMQLGEENKREQKGTSDYVWALKDINFEVKTGEVIGIIGRNGAGKSTLLKILSRVTTPTTGVVKANGRIASLLEVGTGFHPDLTGKENIFLNGAILGMTKRDIISKFDEIVDFSGVEKYIDTPVKRYSSGMYVRLAFAVAAHLEPEILIVDEVLAVGDADFQKKCLGKMKDVSGQGRTVFFVSHNMTAIDNLCDKVLLMNYGRITFDGPTKEGLMKYYSQGSQDSDFENIQGQIKKLPKDDLFELINFRRITDDPYRPCQTNEDLPFEFEFKLSKIAYGFRIGFDLQDESQVTVFRSLHDDDPEGIREFGPGAYKARFVIPKNLLKEGKYYVSLTITIHLIRWIIFDTLKMPIELVNIGGLNKLYSEPRPCSILPKINWEIEQE